MRKQKQKIHSVKSDRYISIMITSNTAGTGKFIRIPKFIIPLFICLLIAIPIGIYFVIDSFKLNIDSLNNDLSNTYSENQALKATIEEDRASAELALSEKESVISDLLASIDEKEAQLDTLELQAQTIWQQLQGLEALKDSIYDKLEEAPEEIYTTEPESSAESETTADATKETSPVANITPYDITTSMASYNNYEDFTSQYESLLAQFSAISSLIEENYSSLIKLSNMTDAYIPYINAVPTGYPITDSRITCDYGYRVDPVTGKKNAFHYGLDFSAAYRQDIFSTADGTVTFAGYTKDFGYNIIVDHGYGYRTRYAHLSKLYVKYGDTVKRGDVIGGAGSSGKSTAVHLHYEVHVNGLRVDPIDFLE